MRAPTMTQLLLFEAPVSATAMPVATVAAASPNRPTPRFNAPSPRRQTADQAASRSLPLYDRQRPELKHMGDLAHMVIRRYELVAERRAILLARGPREAARA